MEGRLLRVAIVEDPLALLALHLVSACILWPVTDGVTHLARDLDSRCWAGGVSAAAMWMGVCIVLLCCAGMVPAIVPAGNWARVRAPAALICEF